MNNITAKRADDPAGGAQSAAAAARQLEATQNLRRSVQAAFDGKVYSGTAGGSVCSFLSICSHIWPCLFIRHVAFIFLSLINIASSNILQMLPAGFPNSESSGRRILERAKATI